MKFIRFHSVSKSFLAKNKLFIKNSVQTCLLMGTADMIAQTVVEKKSYERIDLNRTIRFAFVGLTFVGPTLSIWYRFLTRLVGHEEKLNVIALRKVALDQLVFAPIFIPAYVTAVNVANGKSWNHIQNELKLKYTDIMITNYMLWPGVQLFNFRVMPLRFQVTFNQFIAIFWNTYLSFKVQTNNTKSRM